MACIDHFLNKNDCSPFLNFQVMPLCLIFPNILVKSSPEQIKITASICKHILCDDGSASYSGIDASMQ